MKKNYLFLVLCLICTMGVNAQVTVSQNTSNEIQDGTSACTSESPDFITADNSYYRAFDLDELGYSEFEVQTVTFGVELVENESANFAIEVILYENSGADFPNGTLVEVNRVSVPLTSADTGMLKTVDLTGTVDEREMVVEIRIPDEADAGNTTTFYIGGNNLGETAPTYTFSAGCGDTEPVTFESLGIFGQHLILEVTGNVTLSNDEFKISDVSVSPIPADDRLHIKLSNPNILESIELFSVQGQKLMESKSLDYLDVSNFTAGIYLLQVNTTKGSITKKIAIK